MRRSGSNGLVLRARTCLSMWVSRTRHSLVVPHGDEKMPPLPLPVRFFLLLLLLQVKKLWSPLLVFLFRRERVYGKSGKPQGCARTIHE